MSTINGFSQLWTTMTLNVVLLEIKLILTLSVNWEGWIVQQELVLEVVCAPSFCQTRSICLWKLSISNLPSAWKFYIGFHTHTHIGIMEKDHTMLSKIVRKQSKEENQKLWNYCCSYPYKLHFSQRMRTNHKLLDIFIIIDMRLWLKASALKKKECLTDNLL